MGVGGPLTLLYTASENQKYGDNTVKAILGVFGPTIGGMALDIINGNRPLSAFQKNILPYRNVAAKIFPDTIFKFDQYIKDLEDVLAGKDYTEIQIRQLEDLVDKQLKDAGIKDLQRELQREQRFEGGPVSKDFPVSDVKDIAAERINPFTGEPYLEDEDERIQLRTGGTPKQILLGGIQNYFTEENRKKRLKEKYDKEGIDYRMTKDGPEIIYEGTELAKSLGVKGEPEPGLKNVMPVVEFASMLGGKKLFTEGAETVFQSLSKSRVPKTVYHGSPSPSGLKQITSPNYRVPNPSERLQSAIFTTADKPLARKYASYDEKNIYQVDLSDFSNIKNIFQVGKNQVLNTNKPNKKFLKALDDEITKLSSVESKTLLGQDEKIKAKFLLDFKNQLGPDKYVTRVGPTVKDFLLRNNIKLLKTNQTQYVKRNQPSAVRNFEDNYIILEDSVPIKGIGSL